MKFQKQWEVIPYLGKIKPWHPNMRVGIIIPLEFGRDNIKQPLLRTVSLCHGNSGNSLTDRMSTHRGGLAPQCYSS